VVRIRERRRSPSSPSSGGDGTAIPMGNNDKVKAATKHGPGVKEKRQAVSAARKKSFNAHSKTQAAHHAARNYEDSTRLTEHEENMLEQKKKREAKAAKAAEFRALANAAAENGQWPEQPHFEAPQPMPRSVPSATQVVQLTKHTAIVRHLTIQPTEEELRARVDAMLIGRRNAHRREPVASSSEHRTADDLALCGEGKIDQMLHSPVATGLIRDSHLHSTSQTRSPRGSLPWRSGAGVSLREAFCAPTSESDTRSNSS